MAGVLVSGVQLPRKGGGGKAEPKGELEDRTKEGRGAGEGVGVMLLSLTVEVCEMSPSISGLCANLSPLRVGRTWMGALRTFRAGVCIRWRSPEPRLSRTCSRLRWRGGEASGMLGASGVLSSLLYCVSPETQGPPPKC